MKKQTLALLVILSLSVLVHAENIVKTSTWQDGKYGMYNIGNDIFYTYDKSFVLDFNKKDFMLKYLENSICSNKDLRAAIKAKMKFHYIYVHQGKSMIITINTCEK